MVKKELNKERASLLRRLEQLLDGPMAFLGFVWLALLVVELIWGFNPLLETITLVIWVIFIIDFLMKFFVAPHKVVYLKHNWLTMISLAIPALRVVRVLRFARVLRSIRGLRLVKVVASINRSMRSLGATMRRRGVKYVFLLTMVVLFAGAAGMFALEEEVLGFNNYWSALWWTAMILSSMGSDYWPQTPEGKLLCLLITIYGFGVFGYLTATISSFFIGRDAEEKDAPLASAADMAQLQRQLQEITQNLNELKTGQNKSL